MGLKDAARLTNGQTLNVVDRITRELNTMRELYKLLRTGFPDLPRYQKQKHGVHFYDEDTWDAFYRGAIDSDDIYKSVGNTCDSPMSNGVLAHCHRKYPGYKWSNKICYNPNVLARNLPLVTPIRQPTKIQFDKNDRYVKRSDRVLAMSDDLYGICKVELVAHEAGHMIVNNCHGCCTSDDNHCVKHHIRSRQHQDFFRVCELDGRLQSVLCTNDF